MVYEIIKHSATRWPNNIAIYDEHGALSYAQLHNEIELLKPKLMHLGISKGVGLCVMARNSRQFIIAAFAGLGCGATILPISHQIKAAELAILIAETNLHFILDDKNGVELEGETKDEFIVSGGQIRASEYIANKGKPIAAHVPDAAFIRFTSGTTGKSKGVIISNKSVIERIEAANSGLRISEKDTIIWVLPMAYHFIVSIVLYLQNGASIAICNDFLAPSILQYANKFQATFLYASPMHIRLLASDKSDSRLDYIKTVISTSTAIPVMICDAFKKRFGLEVQQAFGIIEVGLPIINAKISSDNSDAVGHALEDYDIEILDNELNQLSPGFTGQLAIKGPGMFDGYLNPPTLREQILVDGWFITGDLATKSEDGLIRIVGRTKAMINVSGNKAFPEEIEDVLESHPEVKAARVFGGSHPLMGEIVQAEIVLEEGRMIDTESLISYCRERLSTYKVPQRISLVDAIELTGSGKKVR